MQLELPKALLPTLPPPLQPVVRRAHAVILGGREDPYATTAAAAWSRGVLEDLLQLEGLEISLTTASPRILTDRALLAELDRRHTVNVDLALAAVDLELARRLEPRAPEPRSLLAAGARLAAEGITVRLLCRPMTLGVNTLERALRPLFEAARALGALDVRPDPAARREHLGAFERLRLLHGFPQRRAGRG